MDNDTFTTPPNRSNSLAFNHVHAYFYSLFNFTKMHIVCIYFPIFRLYFHPGSSCVVIIGIMPYPSYFPIMRSINRSSVIRFATYVNVNALM